MPTPAARSGTMRWVSVAVLLCLSQQRSVVAQEKAPDVPAGEPRKHVLWVEKRKVPLVLETERIFVLRPGDNPDQSASERAIGAWQAARSRPPDLDAALGFAPDQVAPNDKVRMWEVDVSKRQYAPEGVEKLLDQLAARADIDFAGPAFKTDLGPIIPTGYLIILFWPDLTDEEAERIVRDSGVGSVVAHRHLGMPNHVRVRASTKNGLRVLNLANSLHGTPGVRGAEPDWFVSGKASLIPNDPAFGLHCGLAVLANFGS